MKTLVANAALGIVSVALVLALIVAHEFLAAVADGADRFVTARRWMAVAVAVLTALLAILIIARFYYLRT